MDFRRDNRTIVLNFVGAHEELPCLYPTQDVNYHLYEVENEPSLEEYSRYICRHIIYDWTDFQQGIRGIFPAVFEINTELPVSNTHPLASPLSVVSALLTSAVRNSGRFPILAVFCASPLIRSQVRATPVQLILGLIGQLMDFVSRCRPRVPLTAVIALNRRLYSGANHNVGNGLEFLTELLLALPSRDTVFIVIDRIRYLNSTDNGNDHIALAAGLRRLVGRISDHLNLKLVVTGSWYFEPYNLDCHGVRHYARLVRAQGVGPALIDMIRYRMAIEEGWIRDLPSAGSGSSWYT